jgi:hypothetical protein
MNESSSQSDPIPLDGEPDLVSAERLWVRKAMRDDARMSWARKQARWILVTISAAVAGGWALFGWIRDHIVFK